jgi:predicted DNA-binding transcriptional regulator AlpA
MNDSDRLVTVHDLATYLDIPVTTLYAWSHGCKGPQGFRVGRHLRYRWTDIQRWINQRVPDTEPQRRHHSTRHDATLP